MKKALLLIIPAFLVFSCLKEQDVSGETVQKKKTTVPERTVQTDILKEYGSAGKFVESEIMLPEGIVPTAISVNKGRIYVNDLNKGKIRIFDLKGKQVNEIKVHGLFPTALDVHENIIYHGDITSRHLLRIKTDGKRGLKPMPFYGRWQRDLAVSDDYIFYLDNRVNEIIKTDKYDGSTIERFKAPGRNPTSLTFDGTWLYCGEAEEKQIHIVDPVTGWVIRSIPSPAGHLSGLSFYNGRLYAADLHSNKIHVMTPYPEKPLIEDRERDFRIIYRISSQMESAGTAENLRTYIAIPETRPGQKLLSEVKFSPQPDGYVTDEWGQRFAEFKKETLSSGEKHDITMTVDARVFNAAFHFDPMALNNISARGLEDFLSDGRKYAIREGFIPKKADEIIQDETRYYFKARKLYEYLTDSITYVREGGWGRADTVIKRGTGSCSEYTFALVALFRSVGIPSRYVGALVNRSEHGGLDFVFHRWAEIWMGEKYGWVPVDANAGATEEPEKRGNAFGSIPNRYLVTTVSGGESEYLDWSYNYGIKYDSKDGGIVRTFTLARWVPLD